MVALLVVLAVLIAAMVLVAVLACGRNQPDVPEFDELADLMRRDQ